MMSSPSGVTACEPYSNLNFIGGAPSERISEWANERQMRKFMKLFECFKLFHFIQIRRQQTIVAIRNRAKGMRGAL